MTADVSELKRLAEAATPGPWFTLDQPWLDSDLETQVMSGSPDPHISEPICDFLDASTAGVEDKWEDHDWSMRNWANAAYIAATTPTEPSA